MNEPGDDSEDGMTADDAPEGAPAGKQGKKGRPPKTQRRTKQNAESSTAQPVARGYASSVRRHLKLAREANDPEERNYLVASANVLATLELARTIERTFSSAAESDGGRPLTPEEALDSDLFADDESA